MARGRSGAGSMSTSLFTRSSSSFEDEDARWLKTGGSSLEAAVRAAWARTALAASQQCELPAATREASPGERGETWTHATPSRPEVGLLFARDGGVCSPAEHCHLVLCDKASHYAEKWHQTQSSDMQIKCVSLLLEWTISFQYLIN